ncbi:MAG: leucine-rich repeat domain-containing protein [Mollicutes bacterium PWAP]|nr:leucine-rich repeat domain-containing protein [Mollicutes bacterium PWAP]
MKKRNKYLLNIGMLITTSSPLLVTISCGNRLSGINDILETMKLNNDNIKDAEYAEKILKEDFLISENTKIIGSGAFLNDIIPIGLEIPESVEQIDYAGFKGATFQEGFKLPDSIKKIGDYAFEGSKLNVGFHIPNNASIGRNAFKDVILQKTFFWSIKDSNGNPMAGATVVSDTIPDNKYKNQVLPEDYKIPNYIINIGKSAFEGSTLPEEFKIPDNVKFVDIHAFKNSGFVWRGIGDEFKEYYFVLEKIILGPNAYAENLSFHSQLINIKNNINKENFSKNIKLFDEFSFSNLVLPDGFDIDHPDIGILKDAFKGSTWSNGNLIELPEGTLVESNGVITGNFQGGSGFFMTKDGSIAKHHSASLALLPEGVSLKMSDGSLIPLIGKIAVNKDGRLYKLDGRLITMPDGKLVNIGDKALVKTDGTLLSIQKYENII